MPAENEEYEVVEGGDTYKVIITYSTGNEDDEIKGFPTKADAIGYLLLTNLLD